jgi:hypothetical protein
MKKEKTVEQIANEHARWFVSIVGPIIESTAATFFEHGHKHGVEDERRRKKK